MKANKYVISDLISTAQTANKYARAARGAIKIEDCENAGNKYAMWYHVLFEKIALLNLADDNFVYYAKYDERHGVYSDVFAICKQSLKTEKITTWNV